MAYENYLIKKNRILRRPDIFRIAGRTGWLCDAIPREFLAALVTAAIRAPGIKNINCKRFSRNIHAHVG